MQTRKVNTYGRRSIAIVSAPAGIRGSLVSSSHVLPDRSPSPDSPLSEISAGLVVLPNSPSSLTRPTVFSPAKSRKKKPTRADRSKKENVNLDLSALSISSPPATRRRKRQPILVPSPKVKGSPKQSRMGKKLKALPNSPLRRIPLQRTNQATRVLDKTRESTIDISDDESYVAPKKPSPKRPARSQDTRSKPTRAKAPRISESVIVISDDSIGPESHPNFIPPVPPPKKPALQALSRQEAIMGTPPLLRRRMSGSRLSGGGASRLSFGATANVPPPLPPSPIILSDNLPSPVDSDDEMAFLDVVAELESKPVPPPIAQTTSEPGLIPRRPQPPPFGPSKSMAKAPTVPLAQTEARASKPIAASGLKPMPTSTKPDPLSSRPSILIVELPAPKKTSKPTSRREVDESHPVTEELNIDKPPKPRGRPKSTKQPNSSAKSRSPEKPAPVPTSLPPAAEPAPTTKPAPSKSSTKSKAKSRTRAQPAAPRHSPELLSLLAECSESEPIDLSAFVATFSTDEVHTRFPSTTSGPRRRWQKIGEASYSEVFRLGGVVVKIVPLKMDHDGWNGDDGPCVSEMPDVQKEIRITKTMGDIQEGFIKLAKAYVAFGTYPPELLDLWDAYDREFKSESIRPDSFLPSQMFALLILPDGGPDLEHYTFAPRMSWRAAAGIFWQVARTLARAESLVRFEHRDLHWGQILVQNVPPKEKSKGSKSKAHSNTMDSSDHSGVRVTLIDLGLSRMDTHTRKAYFTKLEPEIFEGEGDYQFDVYRMMKAHCLGAEPDNDDGWENFRPLTNVMWLHYLARQLIRIKGLRKPEATTSKYHTSDDVDAETRAFKCLIEVEKVLAASIVRGGGPAVSEAGGSVLVKSAKSAGKVALKLVSAGNVIRWGAEKRWIQPACGSVDECRGI